MNKQQVQYSHRAPVFSFSCPSQSQDKDRSKSAPFLPILSILSILSILCPCTLCSPSLACLSSPTGFSVVQLRGPFPLGTLCLTRLFFSLSGLFICPFIQVYHSAPMYLYSDLPSIISGGNVIRACCCCCHYSVHSLSQSHSLLRQSPSESPF